MKDFKGTPGPWIKDIECDWSLDTDGENSYCFVGPCDQKAVAAVAVEDAWNSDELLDANAALIAAAPEMLGALQEARETLILCTLIDKSQQSKKTLAIVELAIARALGEDEQR